ncbi:efflux RND transporter periplasmic adaptor subunit [Sinimarinibacterium sp. CAU 1509]|uniref:efflux RND transporter periplasmic adaptor subunit n=1 Tax=Sinimarinibacterium sp. CAU 1509 TaxID=2562283 RepID=UPI0010ABB09E|nr:efflux RND transporter periplasmic adaptor subunit [Sinimarinibacterium sp. CAU 1509]TJY59835.1 efflux RND transporter periplasmic adaptor subunit [Sinimarinibacterium sp. CAU 1509]
MNKPPMDHAAIRNRRLRIAAVAAWVAMLSACSSSEAPAPTAATDTADSALSSAVVKREAVADEARFDATLEAVFQATVAAQTNARVEEIAVDVGDYVEKGQVIARLRATEQQARTSSAEASVREAEARLADAQSEYQRVKDLTARGVLSKAALDKATAALKSVRAQVESARAALNESAEQLTHTVVRAPYSGIVVARHIEVGETATVGSPIMTGLSLEHLRAVVEVPQQEIGAVHARKQARVILPDGSSVEAAELRIPPAADADTHTFRVLVTLPEGDYGAKQAVFPGTLVKVAFVRDERQALLLPPSALVRRSELTAVYVLADGQPPSLRYVRVGSPSVDGRIPVLAGLTEGERVALDPVAAAQRLKNGA